MTKMNAPALSKWSLLFSCPLPSLFSTFHQTHCKDATEYVNTSGQHYHIYISLLSMLFLFVKLNWNFQRSEVRELKKKTLLSGRMDIFWNFTDFYLLGIYSVALKLALSWFCCVLNNFLPSIWLHLILFMSLTMTNSINIYHTKTVLLVFQLFVLILCSFSWVTQLCIAVSEHLLTA